MKRLSVLMWVFLLLLIFAFGCSGGAAVAVTIHFSS
jgi:hypothetical protein